MSSQPPGPGETAQPLPAAGTFMPLVSIRRHYKVGIAVALLVAALGTVFAFKKGKPLYSVTATIYIAPRFVNILREPKDFDVTSYQQFRQFVEHQTKTIGRYDIVLDALRSLGERRKSWQLPGETERQAAERLMGAIKPVAIKDTYLITVSLESGNPDNLDALLNAVVETYIHRMQQETLFYGRDVRIQTLTERRKDIAAAIELRKKRRTEIAQALGVTTFTESSVNPYDEILMDSRTALAKAHRETVAAGAELDVFAGRADGSPRSALDAVASEEVGRDTGLNSLKSGLLGRRAKLLEQISGLDEAHPLHRQIGRELEEIESELKRATSERQRETANHLLEKRRGALRKAQQVERELERQLEAQRLKASEFATLDQEGMVLNAELERYRKQLDEIDNRLDFFETESQAPGYARLETAARPPEYPIGGGKKKLLLMAGAASVLLGLAVPIILDLLDRRIRTVGQAAKILGYAPTAAFFEPSPDLDARRVDADRKRRLAIALDRERRQREARVLLWTSVRPGAGVTGLALEMAQELAELGNRCIVLEANPLKPDRRFNADDKPGLVDVLNGEDNIDAAILPAAGRLPDRVGVGFPGLSHLHNYGALPGILDGLRTRYDIVLLDAPPVLLSADTEFLACLADVTLLLIAAGETLPGDVKRGVEILRKVDPKAVGFIVTRLEIYKGGGYYEKMLRDYVASDQAARDVLKSHPLRQKTT
jgi:Mrp family chromosome partitioning ATPase/uncharacterized protein involved in exopolysaccharide biosynthesis